MAFETPAGLVFLEAGDESTTPFGGFVPLVAFLNKTGFLHNLAESSPVLRSSPNANRIYDIICSFFLTTFIDGSRFAHVNRLREDPLLKELFGLVKCINKNLNKKAVNQCEGGESTDGAL